MKSFQVIRTHLSPYHGPNFLEFEQDRLEKNTLLKMQKLASALTSEPSILITNTHTKLSQLPNELLHNTKLIVHSNSGYDNFTDETELWRDIPVVIGHEIRSQAVAEYCLAALMEALVQLPQHLAWNKSREWHRPLIKDQEIWVYGYGHIGKIVTQTLKVLGAKVVVIDPFLKEISHSQKDHRDARVVIACCSLNSTSQHMFNQDFFKNAHPELIFINGARGRLVHEESLKEFLLSHPKAQAFLDVFEHEPFGVNWYHFPQVWKTSHIAGVSSALDDAIITFEEKVLMDFTSLNDTTFLNKYKNVLLQNKWVNGELI